MTNSSTVRAPAPESRYARVKAIPGSAAAGSPSDYGGLGRITRRSTSDSRISFEMRCWAPSWGLSLRRFGVVYDRAHRIPVQRCRQLAGFQPVHELDFLDVARIQHDFQLGWRSG